MNKLLQIMSILKY